VSALLNPITSESALEGPPLTGEVVVYRGESAHRAAHDHATCTEIARRVAVLKGYRFAGDHGEANHGAARRYVVPTSTLVGIDHARALGIHGEDDLFGGVVPHGFVATKSISHAVVDALARTPGGWSTSFGREIEDVVLDGFSAFCTEDAHRAGVRLLESGPIRIKHALGIGGVGQVAVRDPDELERALADVDADELRDYGVALEQNLTDVTTYSVGQVRIGDLVATYCGTQSLTRNNHGSMVYGGSTLLVARGDFDALLALDHAASARRAITQARVYDDAAFRCFHGLFASRRNYDVAEGSDANGNRRSGVLEQSWRVGGATGAEVEALLAFRADPALQAVRAATIERYGGNVTPPPGATVYFSGTDPRAGPLSKFTSIERYVHTR